MQDIHCNLYSDFCPPSKMQLKSHLCRKKTLASFLDVLIAEEGGKEKKKELFFH